ncbi:MAG: aminotransferase class IV [Deltaproteobacteria bacterium]|nr:aminotransferase class IV [Deltaproteobacteria bacterium]
MPKAKTYKVYLNGSIVPGGKASVTVFDRGLLYGDGLFETMKAADGTIAFKDAHLRRLKKGAALLGIPAKGIRGFFADVRSGLLERLLHTNRLDRGAAYMRITVTRGVSEEGYGSTKCLAPTVLVTARAMDAKAAARMQKKGVNAVFIKGYCPSIPWIKTLNYLPSVLGRAEAARKGASEGIFTGLDGSITEGTSTNVFIVKSGVLKTPAVYDGGPGKGVLPGIVREETIKAAKRLGISVREARLKQRDLMEADEAFLTNSGIEIVPLVRVGARIIGNARPGNVTRMLQRAFGLDF